MKVAEADETAVAKAAMERAENFIVLRRGMDLYREKKRKGKKKEVAIESNGWYLYNKASIY